MLTGTGFISLLARLWHFIGWIWGTVIVGGFAVDLFISLVTMGTRGLSQFDPRTWPMTGLLLTHPLVTAIVLIVAVLFTFACYLAARHEKRERHEQHQTHQEAILDIGRGVHKLLEEAQTKSAPSPVPPAHIVSTQAAHAPPSTPIRKIPYRRNPFFTGREDLLTLVHHRLTTTGAAALTQALAISELGGIGKTQIAVEYAYRYQDHYEAIFWVTAASRETLVADFVVLAHQLELTGRDLEDLYLIVAAVKRWLERHPDWLLILDNADELELLPDFLPVGGSGSILLTTRAQVTGSIAPSISVEQMNEEESSVLLLRRAKVLPATSALTQATTEVRAQAADIVTELDGLPLALDQAGAYIEETDCGLGGYLKLYRSHRHKLLQRRSAGRSDHPEPVATTWHLSFRKAEQVSPAAADLLRLCAFLAPDAIPEVIVTEGAQVLGEVLGPAAANALRLNEAIEVLRRYSLVRRNPDTKMLTIHRLVQAVLQDAMPVDMKKQWKERAQYTQAEHFFQQALAIDEQVYGPEHLEVATDLNNLACLYWNQGKYAETEPLFQHALAIRQQQLGHEDPDTAEALQNLACLYQTQGNDEEAKQMFQAAVMIDEHSTGTAVAIDLSNQADLSRRLGHYEEAESLLERALAIHEQHVGQEDLNTAHILHKQGLLAYEQGKCEAAESFFRRTLDRYEQWLGDEHPNTAQILNALAELSRIQGKYEEAEPLFQRALALKKKQFGEMHSSTAASLNGLALLYLQQGKWVYVKQEKYMKEGRFEEAESLLEHALEIRQHVLGNEHPNTALLLNNLACLYQAQEKHVEAEQFFRHALTIFEKRVGREHPSTTQMLHNLIYCCEVQGKYEEARPLLEQALAIDERLSEHKYPKALLLHRDTVVLLEALTGNAESTN